MSEWKKGSLEYQDGYRDGIQASTEIIEREMHVETIMEEQRRPRPTRHIFKSIMAHLKRLLVD